MQMNCKVIKKCQPPFLHQPSLPFQGYSPFPPILLVAPQVTQFLEGPTILGVPTMVLFLMLLQSTGRTQGQCLNKILQTWNLVKFTEQLL